MSLEGIAQTEYASLSGKIRTIVIDKTLSISGACADAKATGEAIARVEEATLQEEDVAGVVREAVEKAVEDLNILTEEDVKTIIGKSAMTAAEIQAICV